MDFQRFLDELKRSKDYRGRVAHVDHIAAAVDPEQEGGKRDVKMANERVR